MDIQKAKLIFASYDGIMRKKELVNHKLHFRFVKQLMDRGYVDNIKYGYYQWIDDRSYSEVVCVKRLFPDAVICMESALLYYGYIDRTPAFWHLAVNRNSTRSRFKIDFPRIKPYYVPINQLEMGVEEVMIENTTIKIFNREHVICECFRRENKMDGEILNQAIKGYIQDPKKNIPRLMEYAAVLHIEKKIRKVIGVWL